MGWKILKIFETKQGHSFIVKKKTAKQDGRESR
jgi:hypothetical protein